MHTLIDLNTSGHPEATDSIGDGPMRQILDTAMRRCLTWKPDIGSGDDEDVMDVDGDVSSLLDDGYVSLKLSRFPSPEKLDIIFALGRICAWYLVKINSGPDPISPALLELVMNGVSSIMDEKWLSTLYPTLADVLSVVPPDDQNGQRLPREPEMRSRITRICHVRLDTTVCAHILYRWLDEVD